MALNTRDKDKVVKSIARWLAGLRPSFGYRYYFEKYSSAQRAVERLLPYKGLRVCPFCGKSFLRSSAFITHILKFHSDELESLIDST